MGAPPGRVVDVLPESLVVAAQPGLVRLLRLQPEGRAAMSARDFVNGHPVAVGDRFLPLATHP